MCKHRFGSCGSVVSGVVSASVAVDGNGSVPIFRGKKTTTMAATHDTINTHDAPAEQFVRFLRTYHGEDLGRLAQRYPSEQRAIRISHGDLWQFDQDLADDWLKAPDELTPYADEALQTVDIPADISLDQDDELPAEVRLVDLPEDRVVYPGNYSPTEVAGEYLALRGEVAMATDVYPRIVKAAFECQRCTTHTTVPQTGEGFQEPHECHGCERQGPFRINYDRSEFVDAQAIRVQEPPSVAGGEGATVDVHVEADLAGQVETGDEVVLYGTLHLRQRTEGREKTAKFETYLTGRAIDFEESSAKDLDITADERERIRTLADPEAGDHGDPLGLAADSLAPGIHGYDHVKRAAILQLVGGEHVAHPDGSESRGDIHVLNIGDPSTGKSKIVDAVERVAPRAAAVSASNTGKAGMTASAVRDDFGDGEWTLKPGAFAKANGGIVCVEELDDLEAEKRAAMLEPMSKQSIAVSKAGINTKLQTRVGVIAAANPKHGRFDPYEPVSEQFVFGSALLSRFDLVFTFRDQPDAEEDAAIVDHIATHRRAGKLHERGELDTDSEEAALMPPVEHDLLRKWVALASRSEPPIEDAQALEAAKQTFVNLRAANGYEPDDPVPVTFRKFEAVLRLAEAAAKLEFSETIEQRHFETATTLAGRSMRDIGKNEDDEFDADVVETGTSKPQAERKKTVEELLTDLSEDHDPGVPIETFLDEAEAAGIDRTTARDELQSLYRDGVVVEPQTDHYRWIGRA